MSKKWDKADDLPVEEWPDSLKLECKLLRHTFKQMRRRGSEVAAMFVGIKPSGERWVYILQDLMRDGRGKDMVAEIMTDFISGGCKEAFMSCEAWWAEGDEALAWRQAGKSLEKFPGRFEALMVTRYAVEGDLLASARISEGRKLGKFMVKKYASSSGRFANLFMKAQERNAEKN